MGKVGGCGRNSGPRGGRDHKQHVKEGNKMDDGDGGGAGGVKVKLSVSGPGK